VRNHVYPGPEHTVYMADDERQQLQQELGWQPRS
jgi:hypothetical protein